MKKLVLLVAATALLFAACGGGTAASTTPTPAAKATPAPTSKPATTAPGEVNVTEPNGERYKVQIGAPTSTGDIPALDQNENAGTLAQDGGGVAPSGTLWYLFPVTLTLLSGPLDYLGGGATDMRLYTTESAGEAVGGDVVVAATTGGDGCHPPLDAQEGSTGIPSNLCLLWHDPTALAGGAPEWSSGLTTPQADGQSTTFNLYGGPWPNLPSPIYFYVGHDASKGMTWIGGAQVPS